MLITANKVHAQNLCDTVNHIPSADVEYDSGAAEVPADLNSIQQPVFDTIEIPLTVNLAERFGIDLPGSESQPVVATMNINRSGEIFYNGQNITQNIAAACEQGSAAEEEPQDIIPPEAPATPSVKPPKRVEIKEGIEAEELPDVIEGEAH